MTYNKEGQRKIHPPRFVSIHSESEPNYFSGPKDFPKRVCDMRENKARPMAVPPLRSHPKLAVICPKMMGRISCYLLKNDKDDCFSGISDFNGAAAW